ncbi:hypothetical protein PN498_28390 [Oscillatoria sp. CS-180]|uniref:hypothetical protein n=1 Tax=Oscillatoria sp. CS-180 TaxID=3021720 RepID=UPI00232EC8CA|nr:hypothetical protein [Oscillatoria sp. CS-180]MDB9529939.1 hypothetical protein [Oscillatoria sp. CS-180]
MNEKYPQTPLSSGEDVAYQGAAVSMKEWSLAVVCPMVVTFSFFMAVLDPSQRPAFADLATFAFTSSGTFLLSNRQQSGSSNKS